MKQIFIIAALFFILIGATTHQTPLIEQAKWLTGTWENNTGRGKIYEEWKTNNNNTLKGRSYSIRNNDTMVFETIEIIQEKDSIYYIPTVKNQNEGKPVKFGSKEIKPGLLIFENPSHDFPQMISYKRITEDSLVAQISGVINGMDRKKSFPMKRVQ